MVMFWDNEKVFRMPQTAGVFPCLKVGWESTQKVLVKFDQKEQKILDCKLYSAGVLEMDDEERPAQEAQEVKKPQQK